MDSWEWNKIAGAVHATLMFVLVLNIVTGALFEVPPPAKPGFVVEGVPAETASTNAAPAAEAMPDWGTVLPKADTAAGQKVADRCQQCHDLTKGGPNKIGPNLWGVVDRARASHPGFDYSSAMQAKHDPWTYDNLFTYLKLPAAMVPGTKMTFAGIPSAQDRINLIAYLRTLADSPAAIPAPAPAKPAAPVAPAPAAGAAAPAAAGAAPAAAPAAGAAPGANQAAAAGPDIAHGDVAHGKQVAARCQQCHDLTKGGANMIGPNLWDVVNRPRASHPGYDYSTAMSAKHDPWTYANLFEYLKQPAVFVPGTKMTFAGLPSEKDRTDLIAYLRTLSDKPAPLPAK
ncbi:MAG TPA: cytochrome c family protein [Rhizomicrobium sp.]|nr:cytochrome c family protein [Rhizomicrobium sp.]